MSFMSSICLKILFIFREWGRKGESGRETSMCVCFSCVPYWDLACNPGLCPDWESNQGPFDLQDDIQSAEPHQPRLYQAFKEEIMSIVFKLSELTKRISILI